jgi:hypothetical protein
MINSTTLWASQMAALNAQRTALQNSINPTSGSNSNNVFADLVSALSAGSVTVNGSGATAATGPTSAIAATSASANGNGSALGIVLPHPHGHAHGGARGHINALSNSMNSTSSNALTSGISKNLHLLA